MLIKVYIFRIDDKDALITDSVTEAQDLFDKLKSLPNLELVAAKDRSFSTTYDFEFKTEA